MVNTHSFNVALATEIGLERAILLHCFYSWHLYNKDIPDMNRDGRVWFFLSRKKITEAMPYLSEQTIRTTIAKLVSLDLVIKGDYGEHKLNRTNWYTLTDNALALFQNSTNPLVNSTNHRLNQPTNNILTNKENISKDISKKFVLEDEIPFDNEELKLLLLELLSYPNWKKKTPHAKHLRMATLKRIANGDVDKAIASAKWTLQKGWDDFYEPKDYKPKEIEQSKQIDTRPRWQQLGYPSEEVYNQWMNK